MSIVVIYRVAMEIYAIDTADITQLCFSQILAKNMLNWKFSFSQQLLSLDSWAAKLASFWRHLLLHNAHLSDPFISEGHSSRVLFYTWGMPGTIAFFQYSHSQFPLATRLITAPFHTSDTSEKKHTHTQTGMHAVYANIPGYCSEVRTCCDDGETKEQLL